jgi:hypothetical protein
MFISEKITKSWRVIIEKNGDVWIIKLLVKWFEAFTVTAGSKFPSDEQLCENWLASKV